MGCGSSTAKPPRIVVVTDASQTDSKLSDDDILTVVRGVQFRAGELSYNGRSRPMTSEGLAVMKKALDLLDLTECPGNWMSLSWDNIQLSAATTIVMPSTIHQGDTASCGAVTVLEAMAYFRPETYAKLVLAVWTHAWVADVNGRPWGDTADIKPDLLAATPPTTIEGASLADWMVSTAMIAELKDQDAVRDLLGQDDYLGQSCYGPNGSAVEMAKGVTYAWDVKKMMVQLLGCKSVDRDMSYWMFSDGPIDKMVKHTASGAIERGEVVCIALITNWLWRKAMAGEDVEKADGFAFCEHWVRVRSVVDLGGGLLEVKVFSFGEVQVASSVSRAGFGRLLFESLFGVLE